MKAAPKVDDSSTDDDPAPWGNSINDHSSEDERRQLADNEADTEHHFQKMEKLRLRIAELEKYIKGVEVNTSFMRAEKRVRTAIHRSMIKDIQKEIKLDQKHMLERLAQNSNLKARVIAREGTRNDVNMALNSPRTDWRRRPSRRSRTERRKCGQSKKLKERAKRKLEQEKKAKKKQAIAVGGSDASYELLRCECSQLLQCSCKQKACLCATMSAV